MDPHRTASEINDRLNNMNDLVRSPSHALPFKFDMRDLEPHLRRMRNLVPRLRRQVSNRLGDVTVNLPFLSFTVKPKDREKQVAREIVIRLKDRRVLSARECCDNCIEHALSSLQEIRKNLIDRQVELSDMQDGPLYLLIDVMLLGIRRFLTFEESLTEGGSGRRHPRYHNFQRPPDVRQAYLDSLELLRGHLSRCLGQIASLAGMEPPTTGIIANYQGPWQIEAYIPLALSDDRTDSSNDS
jgi:hypothetical protein